MLSALLNKTFPSFLKIRFYFIPWVSDLEVLTVRVDAVHVLSVLCVKGVISRIMI